MANNSSSKSVIWQLFIIRKQIHQTKLWRTMKLLKKMKKTPFLDLFSGITVKPYFWLPNHPPNTTSYKSSIFGMEAKFFRLQFFWFDNWKLLFNYCYFWNVHQYLNYWRCVIHIWNIWQFLGRSSGIYEIFLKRFEY